MTEQVPEALSQLQQLAQAQPENVAAWATFGQAASKAGFPALACEAWGRALALEPGNGNWCFALANQHYTLGNYVEALDRYLQVLNLLPESWEARNNLALLLKFLGERSLAETLLLEAIQLNPAYVDGLSNLGNLYREQGALDRALHCFASALRLKPDHVGLLTNYGLLQKDRGLLSQALAHYRRALALDEQAAEPAFNMAIALIQSGNFSDGFAWYERRWVLPGMARNRQVYDQAMPAWTDQSLQGKTLLLWQEQGLGDLIQMVRFLPDWQQKQPDCRLLLRVPKSLHRLLAPFVPAMTLLDVEAPMPAADFHLSVMSLPHLLQATPESVADHVPYLQADPALVAEWATRLPTETPNRRRIGVVWQSGRSGVGDEMLDQRQRSLSEAALASLLEDHSVDWVSLQLEAAPPEALESWLQRPGPIRDFADTAAILQSLDALVTVDTAAAHLAGALGKPTFVLMRANGGNLFPASGCRMPWYPSMQILRQIVLDDWDAVIAELRGKY